VQCCLILNEPGRCKWASTSGKLFHLLDQKETYTPSSLNGCSFKTAENLVSAKTIRLDKLMLETGMSYSSSNYYSQWLKMQNKDAPWCSMTSTQASKPHLDTLPPELRALFFPQATQPERFVYGKAVKGRNEPCAIGGVAWVIHKLHDGIPIEDVMEKVWKNTVELFKLDDIE
jgi:TatD DNase family protein